MYSVLALTRFKAAFKVLVLSILLVLSVLYLLCLFLVSPKDYGIIMEEVWNLYGICMEALWNKYGIWYGICTELAWKKYGIIVE